MTIFYFTATGNSLYIAKSIGGKLISIPKIINMDILEYEDDSIGIVFPIYSHRPPKMVRNFLKKTRFKADYIFAIGTYGSMTGAAMTNLQNDIEKFGHNFNYVASILMVDNFLPIFDIDKEIKKIPAKKIEENKERIISDVKNKKINISKSSLAEKLITSAVKAYDNYASDGKQAKKFIINDNCNLCGICSKVCPTENIKVTSKVDFYDKCEGCLACINLCPQNAIHLKSERSSKRWKNPDVSLKEIIDSNNVSNL